jgi:hypothetical protein
MLVFLFSPFGSSSVRANPIEEAEQKIPSDTSTGLREIILSQVKNDFYSRGYVENGISLRDIALISLIFSGSTTVFLYIASKK